MKKLVLFGALALLSTSSFAHADVTWEHTARVFVGGSKPLVTFNLRNDWSGDNHRTRLSFDASPVAAALGGMGGGPSPRGTVDVIERLGDDRLILALRNAQNTGVSNYVEEPYTTLQSRLRINFFEALDPAFAAQTDPIPQLSDEQRRRLGQELRAFTRPFAQTSGRQFFRALPGTRTLNGIESRGFRYTSLVIIPEAAGVGKGQSVRLTSEFWVASNQSGDGEILDFTRRANELKAGAPTVSMWINEALPILAEAMPEESQAFVAALIGRKGQANYGFQGTPTQFSLTVTLPPAAQMMAGGDIRLQADLKRRSNDPIPTSAFATPTEGTRTKIEPFLQIMRNAVTQGREAIKQQMGSL